MMCLLALGTLLALAPAVSAADPADKVPELKALGRSDGRGGGRNSGRVA